MNKSLLAGLIALIIVIVGVVLFMDLSQQPNMESTKIAKVIPAARQNIPVLAVNNNYTSGFDEADYLQGGTAVLLLQTSKTPAEIRFRVIKDMPTYLSFDANRDNKLDLNDPVFGQLNMLTYDPKTRIRKIVSLRNRGVQAIVLNHTSPLGLPANIQNQYVGEMIMADGSRLPVKFISMDANYIITPLAEPR